MKEINGFWTDGNNNKWRSDIYTLEESMLYSATLINCYNCFGCNNCNNCTDCVSCTYCNDCKNCKESHYCNKCDTIEYCNSCMKCYSCKHCDTSNSLKDCKKCDGCSDCVGCFGCRGCKYCDNCNVCINYMNIKKMTYNPISSYTPPLKNKCDIESTYYNTNEGIKVLYGGWWGSIEEFEIYIQDDFAYPKWHSIQIEKAKLLFL